MFDLKRIDKVNEPQFISKVKAISQKGKMGSFIDFSSMFGYEMFAFAENTTLQNDSGEAVKYGVMVHEDAAEKLFDSPMAVAHTLQALRKKSIGSDNIAGVWISSNDVYKQILAERRTANAVKGDKLRVLISTAQEASASDVHIVLTPDHAFIQFRIQSKLFTYYDSFPRSDMNYILREMFNAPTSGGHTNSRFDFEGSLDFQASVMNLNADYTINVRYHHSKLDKGRVDVTMRLAPIKNGANTREHRPLIYSGFLTDQSRLIDEATLAPDGMLVLSGVTGSGKTTTIINQLIFKYVSNNSQIKLVTIEDPNETQLPFLRSKDINATRPPIAIQQSRKATDEEKLEQAIKDLGREDPDGVLLGEIRAQVAAIAAVHLVDTGQHIMTTIHTRNCLGVFEKLLNLGCPADIILKPEFFAALVYQELVQSLCNTCKLTISEAENYSHYGIELQVSPENSEIYVSNQSRKSNSISQVVDDNGSSLFFSESKGIYSENGNTVSLNGRLKTHSGMYIDQHGCGEDEINPIESRLILNPDRVILGHDMKPILLFPVHRNEYPGVYNEEGRKLVSKKLIDVINRKLPHYKNQFRFRDPKSSHVKSSKEYEPIGCPDCESGRKEILQPNSNKIDVGLRGLSTPALTIAAEVLKPTSKLLNHLSNSLNSGIEYYSSLYRLEGRHTCDGLTSKEHYFSKALKGEVCLSQFNSKYPLESFLEYCEEIEDKINMQLASKKISINNGKGFKMLEYLNDISILKVWQKEYRKAVTNIKSNNLV